MSLAIRKEVKGSVDEICAQITEVIKAAGFGILTRIDFDQKIKEKLNQDLPKTVILGACNPKLAYDAFKQTADVGLLIPCNIMVREKAPGLVVVEAMRPSKMLDFLPSIQGRPQILEAERALEEALESLG